MGSTTAKGKNFIGMNRYERTHRELKKQLDQLIASDNDTSMRSSSHENKGKEQSENYEVVNVDRQQQENEQNN